MRFNLCYVRYFLDLSFQGTAYAGWQIQPNAPSVQAAVEEALSVLLRSDTRVTGAGRTDAGVHAEQLFAHFDHEGPLPHRFFSGLNGLLPPDIGLKAVYQADPPELHARFSATYRAYRYQIVTQKTPLLRDFSLFVPYALDLPAMQAAAALLPAYDSFESFCKARGDNQTYHCRIDEACWETRPGLLLFHLQADRFLRGMVRAITGTLLQVGQGKLDLVGFRQVIEAKDRRAAGPNTDAKGLFLTQVGYPAGTLTQILPLPPA